MNHWLVSALATGLVITIMLLVYTIGLLQPVCCCSGMQEAVTVKEELQRFERLFEEKGGLIT